VRLHEPSLVNNFISVNIPLQKTLNQKPMTRNSTSTIGAIHPILFFVLVYAISLFMAFFVCRVIYYAVNGNTDVVKTEEVKGGGLSYSGASISVQATALR
jgi:hypothetical protein